MRVIQIHNKLGFLLVGNEVFTYRYRETTEQLTITNRDGGALCQPLAGDDARAALAKIQQTENA